MPTDPIKKIYLYNAHGYGFGGRIDRPFQHVLDVHAGASLPTTGGYEVSRRENFRLNEIISYTAAHTVVAGSRNEKDGSYTTLASSTIEGLNILDMVTADRIVARVASKQLITDDEPTITPIGSHFENLRIAGCPIEVELDTDLFNRFGTFSDFKKAYEGISNTAKGCRRRSCGASPSSKYRISSANGITGSREISSRSRKGSYFVRW